MRGRFRECDTCGEHARPHRVILEMVTTRPSDPSELVCVMTTCTDCVPDHDIHAHLDPDQIPGQGTTQQIDRWVADHGTPHGVWFYS